MENFIKTISLPFLQTVIFNELYFVDINVEKNISNNVNVEMANRRGVGQIHQH